MFPPEKWHFFQYVDCMWQMFAWPLTISHNWSFSYFSDFRLSEKMFVIRVQVFHYIFSILSQVDSRMNSKNFYDYLSAVQQQISDFPDKARFEIVLKQVGSSWPRVLPVVTAVRALVCFCFFPELVFLAALFMPQMAKSLLINPSISCDAYASFIHVVSVWSCGVAMYHEPCL